MKTRKILIALVLAVALLGCGKPQPRHIVILPDVSGSIDRSAEEKAFKAIDELISHLRRGDKVTIIPILGDAQAEASGRIIRFEVPTERRAYDVDLRDFRLRLKASLGEMEAGAVAHPGTKTDILGSIALAEQEFQLEIGRSKPLLVVLSDFIQEDRDVDFRRDKRVASRASAKEFAAQATKRSSLDFKGMAVYLGELQSDEYTDLGRSRRDAIQEFWIRYFLSSGAHPRFVTDGPGLLGTN
jgi:hypothetical protein